MLLFADLAMPASVVSVLLLVVSNTGQIFAVVPPVVSNAAIVMTCSNILLVVIEFWPFHVASTF